jgi:plasmid stabilization system protein ParE
MTRRLELHEDADRELSEAAAYYELERTGLGEAFVAEVEAAFGRVREHPDSAAETRPGIRRLVLLRFPYSLIYEARPDTIRILAVAHQRKRPYYWRRDADRGGHNPRIQTDGAPLAVE